MRAGGEVGENILLVKISTYTVAQYNHRTRTEDSARPFPSREVGSENETSNIDSQYHTFLD